MFASPSPIVFVALLIASAVLAIIVVTSLLYLCGLLLAATVANRVRHNVGEAKPSPAPTHRPRLAVVIPAHNEEVVLGATLRSLREQDYAGSDFSVVVVADNCTDTTAALARAGGANVVLERQDLTRRGKGYALEWAFTHLLGVNSPLETPADAFIIVDADTFVAPDFLSTMAARLISEAGNIPEKVASTRLAIQGRYGVLNPDGGWRAALMTAAFDLCNHVKLLGAAHLGLAVGLKGNGMAFTRAVLEEAPWQGRSITEDIDFGLDLLLQHRLRVQYEPAARVWAQMPVDGAQATSQRERWERGRYRLLRDRTPQLIGQGIRRRDIALVIAGLDLAIPPLAEIVAFLLLWGGLGTILTLLFPGHRLIALNLGAWAVSCVALLWYVLAGLRAAEAPPQAYTALWRVPSYILWKLALYVVRFVVRPFRRFAGAVKSPGQVTTSESALESDADAWIRTERIALDASVPVGTVGKAKK